MACFSDGYPPQSIELVRGSARIIRIRARNPDGALKDMTGKTVRFTATGGGHEIDKMISAFALESEAPQIDVACGIDVSLTEADTRGIAFAMTWECEDEDHVVFAGGPLTAMGGANKDGWHP